ncbi:exonuclease V subunit gamma [Acinetobacter sp. SWAC5]|uniref:exodeoxyribonuclease V subunit gamma n=1 Tax=Acinetobacter sp. SWAC5 TaxID=2293835 RepID=UPI000E352EE3|nr:exodeoxyribonuclease V subunit gamma [Acinetobacter sp. SWAC5]RFS29010.1 exonuclease V subunit gamma [Acinetobacter sp. SWAC5]
MAIRVIQSQRVEILLEAMIQAGHQAETSPLAALKTQHFIVPSMAVQTWLTTKLSEQQGISANTMFHQRIRAFQWFAYQAVLDDKEKVRKANIPRLIIKWRTYQILKPFIQQANNPLSVDHPLHSIVQRMYDSASRLSDSTEQQLKKQGMLYWVSEQVSRLFSNYMEYRGHCLKQHAQGESCDCAHNWLKDWGNNQPLDLDKQFFMPRPLFPGLDSKEEQVQQQQISSFALAQAEQLEQWQRWLWHSEFHADFELMQSIDQNFWQVMDDPAQRVKALQALPKQVVLFTVLDLPPSQLSFLRRLGQYMDVLILHFNPSQEYWADTVDANWKKQYDVKLKQRFQEKNPEATTAQIDAFFEKYTLEYGQQKDSRHPLLTRFGKQARDHFSLLVNLASGEQDEEWHDLFPMDYEAHLLGKLQSDILNLAEPEPESFELLEQDDSIQLHVCHSSLRQLEVLKDQLVHWLSQSTPEQPRQPNDILVLSPQLKELEPLIRSVFAPPPREQSFENTAQQTRKDSVYLPVKIAGVPQLDTQNAWRAVLGPIQLGQGRFSLEDFADWLNLGAVQTRYALSTDQAARMIELLSDAKFKRGLDEEHLKRSLAANDQDYRYSFKFALDRLVLGVAVPEHVMLQDTLSYAYVRPEDFELINILITMYQDFAERRHWLVEHEMGIQRNVEEWLHLLLRDLDQYQKHGVTALKAVRDTLRKYITLITLSYYTEDGELGPQEQLLLKDMQLPLPYLLQEIQNTIDSQMDQAVPTGQITFSQMGQIRPLPYKLIVMLNLDSGKFPSRQVRLPFDLMDVLKSHLGDRSRLDDEQGAFLDALLLAKDNLWLFYNGFDVNDGEIREPSSVVQEFIRHLAVIVQGGRAESTLPLLTTLDSGIEVPDNLKILYRIHSLQPFELQNFVHTRQERKIRYQDHWFHVAQQLQQAQGARTAWASKALKPTEVADLQLDSSQWIKQVTFPAELYLKTLGIVNPKPEDSLATDEPLLLDGLEKYAVRNSLLQSTQIASEDLLLDQLPVGKLKEATWNSSLQQHEALLERVKAVTQSDDATLTPVTQRMLSLETNLQMQITVPAKPVQTWVSLTASSARGRRRAQIWLEYLLWLHSLPEQETQSYQRIEVCGDLTVYCQGVSPAQARVHIQAWLKAWRYGQQRPLVLPANLLLASEKSGAFTLENNGKGNERGVRWIEKEAGILVLEQIEQLKQKWTAAGDYSAFDIRFDEANQAHLDWAFILRDQDSKQLLEHCCELFAYALYQPIFQHQTAE